MAVLLKGDLLLRIERDYVGRMSLYEVVSHNTYCRVIGCCSHFVFVAICRNITFIFQFFILSAALCHFDSTVKIESQSPESDTVGFGISQEPIARFCWILAFVNYGI